MTRKVAVHRPGFDNLPPGLSPEERRAAGHPGLSQEHVMPETPAASPTGTPVVPATGIALKVAAAVVGLAAIFLASDFFPATNLDEKIAGAIVSIGTVLGIYSPGVRK